MDADHPVFNVPSKQERYNISLFTDQQHGIKICYASPSINRSFW